MTKSIWIEMCVSCIQKLTQLTWLDLTMWESWGGSVNGIIEKKLFIKNIYVHNTIQYNAIYSSH